MKYEDFEKKLISQLLKDKKKCIDLINDNEKIVVNHLKNTEKPLYIKGLVNKLNDIISENLKSFKLTEKVLRHELFDDVLTEFRKSDVLLKAIKKGNVDAVKWLITMNIDYFVHDENGAIALMYAAENSSFTFLIKEILKNNVDSVNIVDNNGNTALFYSKDEKSFSLLCEANPNFNHINKDGDTLLIKCCKRSNCPNFSNIINRVDDVDHANHRGKTALMYLVENSKYTELQQLCKRKPNFNYKNSNNESAVSILIRKFKEIYDDQQYPSYSYLKNHVFTMYNLVLENCNFNIPIDKDGNTPIMFFIMNGDYFATTLLLEKYKNLNLKVKNEYGINASYLYFTIDPKELVLRKEFINHPSFDCDFVDNDHNTMIMHFLVREKVDEEFHDILERKKIKTNEVNHHNENALIMATKLGLLCKCECLVETNYLNQQDNLGNTALHYAIKLKDREAINLLMYYKADPTIKNYQGQSPLDLANEINEETINEILKNPILPEKMKENLKKEEKPSLFFNKKNKKSTEEKLDKKLGNYVMEYQIKNYKQEYEYLIKNKKRTYPLIHFNDIMLSYFVGSYIDIYATNAPKKLQSERANELFERDRYELNIFDNFDSIKAVSKINYRL